jgi:hypothetical protein
VRRILLGSSLIAAIGLSLIPVSGRGSSADASVDSPAPRTCPAMAYDRAREQIVLFGGSDANYAALGDTWTWDGAAWTEQHTVDSPPPDACSAVAYDAARQEVVLFDSPGDDVVETWTWDGTNWNHEFPRHSPRGTYGIVMAYDAARSVIVLFGDDYDDGRADTWTWDGTDWTDVGARAPRGRDLSGIAYDAAREQVVLFGGQADCDDLGCFPFKDTFTWEGSAWERRRPATSPGRRATMGMAYDEAHGQVVLFGGNQNFIGGRVLGDTWTWDGSTWTRQFPETRPSRRAAVGMAYDAARGEIVLFGGWSYEAVFAETWTYDGTTWTNES